MRIIAGQYKGRHIESDARLKLRPTTDFAKEALFNILENRILWEGKAILDLFAGTGSISYEFASRGVAQVHSVEIEKSHVDYIRKNLSQLQCKTVRVVRDDVFHFLKICHQQYDIIFADPPYDLATVKDIPGLVFQHNLLKSEGVLIVEHSKKVSLADLPNYVNTRNYGSVHFSFFSLEEKVCNA